jgi:molecular chaperone DnaJ
MKKYYEDLELERDATQENIAWAYCRLSLQYHPKRNEQKDLVYNNFKFSQIAEAYEVLSNRKSILLINNNYNFVDDSIIPIFLIS